MNNDANAVQVREPRFADFRSLDRLLESFFGEPPAFGLRRALQGPGLAWTPSVDIRETDSELVVYAAVPGLSKDEVSLEVKDNTLVLTGRIKALGSEQDSWLRRELPRGEFFRAFELPAEVRADKVKAVLRDGILEVRLPKAEEAKPRRISID